VARRREISRLHDEIEELFADLWMVPRFSSGRDPPRPARVSIPFGEPS
jgi:hypothetical protein